MYVYVYVCIYVYVYIYIYIYIDTKWLIHEMLKVTNHAATSISRIKQGNAVDNK